MFFVLFFLLLLDNGRSKDHIQVGNNFSEKVEVCEEDEEVYRSVDEHGGDGQGDLEEEEGSGSRETWDPLSSLFPSRLLAPKELPGPLPGFIDVAMILLGLQANERVTERSEVRGQKLVKQFTKMIDSIFLYSKGTPLRLIFLTDSSSVESISNLLRQRASRYLTYSLLVDPHQSDRDVKLSFPRIQLAFVRASDIADAHREGVVQLKSYFGKVSSDGKPTMATPWKPGVTSIVWNTKYLQDLFYFLPYHHLEFPLSLKKLIIIDVDLEFSVDMLRLYKHFDKFAPSEVISCGVTQSPFYFGYFKEHRKSHPESLVGRPGRFQGLNTGVLLLDLEKMRKSSEYNHFTTQSGVKELAEKWKLGGTVGDQDWLTLLSFEKPELINILPCEFNREEHRPGECHGDTKEEWEVRDAAYHHCPGIIRIRHRAGSI